MSILVKSSKIATVLWLYSFISFLFQFHQTETFCAQHDDYSENTAKYTLTDAYNSQRQITIKLEVHDVITKKNLEKKLFSTSLLTKLVPDFTCQ